MSTIVASCRSEKRYQIISSRAIFGDALHERAVREVVEEISWVRQRKIFAGLLSRQSWFERKSADKTER
jgi:hypothetical protein